jgi:hypothetical protein
MIDHLDHLCWPPSTVAAEDFTWVMACSKPSPVGKAFAFGHQKINHVRGHGFETHLRCRGLDLCFIASIPGPGDCPLARVDC